MSTIIFPTYLFNIELIPSLAIDNPKTNTNGAIALNGFNVDKTGIHYIIAIHKKYMLA